MTADIEIDQEQVIAKLIENNFYVFDTPHILLLLLSFIGVNSNILRIGHSILGHLGKQNIFCLKIMSEEIDFFKPPSIDVYPLCSQATIHIEPNKDKIEPGQYLLDLIYSDISGPYICNCPRAKYYVTFFDDFDKASKFILLFSNNRVLAAFDSFCK